MTETRGNEPQNIHNPEGVESAFVRPLQGRRMLWHYKPRVPLRFTRGYYYLSPTGFYRISFSDKFHHRRHNGFICVAVIVGVDIDIEPFDGFAELPLVLFFLFH